MYFPILDEKENKIYEKKLVKEKGEEIEEIEKEIKKLFVLEDIKDITMTEGLPTLWGAMQKLIEKVEKQDKLIKDLQSKKQDNK